MNNNTTEHFTAPETLHTEPDFGPPEESAALLQTQANETTRTKNMNTAVPGERMEITFVTATGTYTPLTDLVPANAQYPDRGFSVSVGILFGLC